MADAPVPWLKVVNFATNHHDTYDFIDPTKADLYGKSVLITGASKGIGKATAISFARAGCSKIAIGARSPLAEVEKLVKRAATEAGRPEPTVLCLELDVSSNDSVKAAAAALASSPQFNGVLDILINNAGYLEKWFPIAETDPAEWWKSWEVNMKGTFLCCHHLLPMVLKSDAKLVLNLSSAGAHNLSLGGSAYQTSRFAACRFTEFVVQDYAGTGLVAIAVHPGGVPTELALRMPEHKHAILIDTAELAADAMVWLSRERREWLSGRFVSCCWDMKELEGKKDEIEKNVELLKFRMVV